MNQNINGSIPIHENELGFSFRFFDLSEQVAANEKILTPKKLELEKEIRIFTSPVLSIIPLQISNTRIGLPKGRPLSKREMLIQSLRDLEPNLAEEILRQFNIFEGIRREIESKYWGMHVIMCGGEIFADKDFTEAARKAHAKYPNRPFYSEALGVIDIPTLFQAIVLVTLFKKGSAFYTKISVVGIKRELTEVLVDSGAAITGLKKEVINNCSLQPKGIKFVPTPIGGAMMQVYECDIEVNGRAIKSIFPVKVLDSKHPSGKIIESENLLGRDVLREFRIFIDWKKGEGNLEDPQVLKELSEETTEPGVLEFEFKVLKEPWNKYRLSDKALLKFKFVLARVIPNFQGGRLMGFSINGNNVLSVSVPRRLMGQPDFTVYTPDQLNESIDEFLDIEQIGVHEWNVYMIEKENIQLSINVEVVSVARTKKYNNIGEPIYLVNTQPVIRPKYPPGYKLTPKSRENII